MSRIEISSDALIDPVLLDFSRTCRLCLQQAAELSPLYPETEPSDSALVSLPSKIMACVSIEVSPKHNTMPKQVCSKCVQQIDSWVKFKELCESANALLQQCLANLQGSSHEDTEKERDENISREKELFTVTSTETSVRKEQHCQFIQDNSRDPNEKKKSYVLVVKESRPGSNLDDNRINNNCEENDNVSKNNNDVQCMDESKEIPDSIKKVLKRKPTESSNKKLVNNETNITSKNLSKWKLKYERYQKKKYICGLKSCDKIFSRFCDLVQHDRLEHEDIVMDKICDICGKMFSSEDRIKIHLSIYHSEKKFLCKVCGGKFLSKASLRSHLKKHSGRWVCSVCGLHTASNMALLEHCRKHSGEKPFICDTCGQSYVTKTSLNLHKQSHTKELLFKCNLCDYKATCHSSMHMHKVTHSVKKDCICETCGKMFKLPARLKEHRKIHNPVKKHTCDICKMAFSTKYRLTLHTRVHSGERPFSCDTCNKQFARRDALKEHIRTHTGEQRYTCNSCSKSFSFLKSLKNHKCNINNVSNASKDNTLLPDNNDNVDAISAERLTDASSTQQDVLSRSLTAPLDVSLSDCLFQSN